MPLYSRIIGPASLGISLHVQPGRSWRGHDKGATHHIRYAFPGYTRAINQQLASLFQNKYMFPYKDSLSQHTDKYSLNYQSKNDGTVSRHPLQALFDIKGSV